MKSQTVYNVTCLACGRVWTPGQGSPLWWKASKRAQEGYLDALRVNSRDCGCKEPQALPEAPYRVMGYDDMCRDFDLPFDSLVQAAQKYLELERSGGYVVIFVDATWSGSGMSPTRKRLQAMAWK